MRAGLRCVRVRCYHARLRVGRRVWRGRPPLTANIFARGMRKGRDRWGLRPSPCTATPENLPFTYSGE
jgi:hypothetical protein